MNIVETIKHVQSNKRTAMRLCNALEVFLGVEPRDAKGIKAMCAVGRASIRKETAKGFIHANVAQTLNIIKQQVEGVKLRISTGFIDACRDVTLETDCIATLNAVARAMRLWNDHKAAIKAAAEAKVEAKAEAKVEAA